MIGRLRGQLIDSEADGTLVLDVGGVGYELAAPLGALGRMARDKDGTITLHVHTNLREGAIELFAFPSNDERTTFRALISISKVGPKLALAVLSVLSVGELVQLIETNQARQLTQVPGIGKKTAERIVLELKGKLGLLAGAPTTAGPLAAGTGPADPAQATMVRDALLRMGFKTGEAERAVASLVDLERPLDQLMRDALVLLAP